MLGEIRDAETAHVAVNTSLTGHLILSTLHTNDAPTTIPRLIDMGIDPYLIASTLRIVIGQRLVRKLCSCARIKQLSLEEQISLMTMFSDAVIERSLIPTGCELCHFTGFKGRVGIYEVLVITDALRTLIMQKAPAHIIKQQARQRGMLSMLDDGLRHIQAGLSTPEEMLAAIQE